MTKGRHSHQTRLSLLLLTCLLLLGWNQALAAASIQEPAQEKVPPQKKEAATSPAQTQTEAAEQSEKSAEQSEQQAAEQERGQRRIVDPRKFPPQSPLPARVLLAPFRALGPKVEKGMNYVESSNALERVRLILSNPYLQPLFGNLGDGSGFGGGVRLSTADRISTNTQFFLSTHLTAKRYLETIVGAQTDPTGGARKVFNLELAARYRLRPEENFFGLGPQSSFADQSAYYLQERGVGLTASLRLHRRVRVGAGVDYSSSRVFEGRDDDATTQDRFGNNQLLAQGAALLGLSAFAELDHRDQPSNPRRGAFLRLSAASYDSVGRGDFGFVNLQLDTRGYLPLGSERRVLALRLLGDFNSPKGGSQIPFFRLARLGNTQTLRGFESNRFYGRHALAASIEYRYALSGGMEAVTFTDLGQVFNRWSEFNRQNFRATFGGGVQFKSEKSVFFKILVARSGEGTRLFLSFGPTF
jgi:hypothetical protein